ncbi:MAG: carboxy-S-adenosyl-L-methionine synthase CmoA [Alphaproteobacteria bacterium]
MQNNRDKLFDKTGQVDDFVFDASVTHVFDDMVRRSVPGYQQMLEGIRAFAPTFVKPNTQVFDLGCSLGSASLAVLEGADHPEVAISAVDMSEPMLSQARNRLSAYKTKAAVSFHLADICEVEISNASLVVLNLTLQFVEPSNRAALIRKIYKGLNVNGALIVSEKVRFDQPDVQNFLDQQQMDFKRNQGYSDLEIAQKRSALENVMKLDTIPTHLERFTDVGFKASSIWYQNLNFCSFIAIKN